MPSESIVKDDYIRWLGDMKSRIRSARLSAARTVNREVIRLYWDIGRGIIEKQQTLGWGKSVVETLSRDLQSEFPGIRGFSADNLWRMRQFYSEYSHESFLAQVEAAWKHLKVAAFLEQAVPEIRKQG